MRDMEQINRFLRGSGEHTQAKEQLMRNTFARRQGRHSRRHDYDEDYDSRRRLADALDAEYDEYDYDEAEYDAHQDAPRATRRRVPEVQQPGTRHDAHPGKAARQPHAERKISTPDGVSHVFDLGQFKEARSLWPYTTSSATRWWRTAWARPTGWTYWW